MAWSVETRKRLALSIGYFCIFVYFSLTTYITYVYYSTIAPSILKQKKYKTFLFHFIFGNWLVINIYFNHWMAWLSSPGLSKDYQHIAGQNSTCKKCSTKKPPRTHHCSWCDLCILKFDHHCPWLNNCVGFYNHRYFFQFCCFMTTGCFYAGTFGLREYQIGLIGKQRFYYLDAIFRPFLVLDTLGIKGFITYFIFLAAFTIGFLLFGLVIWHGLMIGRGVTSLERVLNKEYARQSYQQGFIFVNPYDFGFVENWKRFFNVHTIGEFIKKVLFPSTHKPEGDGITWDGYNINTNLQTNRRNPQQKERSNRYYPYGCPNLPRISRANQYRSVIPPWEQESKQIRSSNSVYQPETSKAESIKTEKND